MENSIKVLTTGGTIDKEYPQGVGGHAFEFGTVTAAQRIKKRTHSKFEIERICSVDSQGSFIPESRIPAFIGCF